jgi:hypothetical protein
MKLQKKQEIVNVIYKKAEFFKNPGGFAFFYLMNNKKAALSSSLFYPFRTVN